MERVRKRVREKENYIVFGGRPSAHKGLAETLIIFKQISKHFAGIKLIITGRIPNKTLILVKKICKRLDIEDKVVFTGFIPREDRFKIIAKAKLMLYPSHEDAFPYAVLESLHLETLLSAIEYPPSRSTMVNLQA